MHTLQSYEYVNLTVNYNDSPRGSRPQVVDGDFLPNGVTTIANDRAI
jgi:hypothetical protein